MSRAVAVYTVLNAMHVQTHVYVQLVFESDVERFALHHLDSGAHAQRAIIWRDVSQAAVRHILGYKSEAALRVNRLVGEAGLGHRLPAAPEGYRREHGNRHYARQANPAQARARQPLRQVLDIYAAF